MDISRMGTYTLQIKYTLMSKLFILQPNDYNDRVKGKKKMEKVKTFFYT